MATRVDVEALYASLDAARKSRGISWRVLAHEAGVSPSTLTRMAQGGRPDVDGFAALVRWLGVDAGVFVRNDDGAPAKEAEPAAFVVSYLRARKDMDPETVAYVGDILQAAYKRLAADHG